MQDIPRGNHKNDFVLLHYTLSQAESLSWKDKMCLTPPHKISNSQWSFGYKFKLDDIPDVKNAEIIIALIVHSDRGIHHKLLLTSLMFHLVISAV
jgi:hypothetical protein